jgi:hypothetical protein
VMKRNIFLGLALLATVVGASTESLAQMDAVVQYNPNSIDPIPAYEHHYRTKVWRRVYLEEKQNKGFFAVNAEISKFVIDLVKNGEIEAFKTADLVNTTELKYTNEELRGLLLREEASTFEEWNPSTPYEAGNIVSFNGKKYAATYPSTGDNPEANAAGNWELNQSAGEAREYNAREMTSFQLVEDLIFDKRRGRLYHDIQAIEFIISDAESGAVKSFGWYRYKDLEAAFRKYPEKAIWVNRQNYAQNKNFADAFLLRLFKGYLTKVENPDDMDIIAMITSSGGNWREGVNETYRQENLLMEKEHNLWEF